MGIERQNTPDHLFQYNGKEKQQELGFNWMDYEARFYTPLLGRFTTVDPHAEGYGSFSPYAYVLNNPIIFTDPTGMDTLRVGSDGIPIAPPIKEVEIVQERQKGSVLSTAGRHAAIEFTFWHKMVEAGKLALSLNGLYSDGSQTYGSAPAPGIRGLANVPSKLLPPGPSSRMVKHHIFNVFRGKSPKSQKYRDFFKKHGINVDDHAVEIPEGLHKHIHRAGNNWTTKWKEWIDANPNATTKDVYQQAGRMLEDTGLNHQPIISY